MIYITAVYSVESQQVDIGPGDSLIDHITVETSLTATLAGLRLEFEGACGSSFEHAEALLLWIDHEYIGTWSKADGFSFKEATQAIFTKLLEVDRRDEGFWQAKIVVDYQRQEPIETMDLFEPYDPPLEDGWVFSIARHIR